MLLGKLRNLLDVIEQERAEREDVRVHIAQVEGIGRSLMMLEHEEEHLSWAADEMINNSQFKYGPDGRPCEKGGY